MQKWILIPKWDFDPNWLFDPKWNIDSEMEFCSKNYQMKIITCWHHIFVAKKMEKGWDFLRLEWFTFPMWRRENSRILENRNDNFVYRKSWQKVHICLKILKPRFWWKIGKIQLNFRAESWCYKWNENLKYLNFCKQKISKNDILTNIDFSVKKLLKLVSNISQ